MESKAEEVNSRIEKIDWWNIRVTSYKVGAEYVCVVDNVDPGANIARGRGTSRDEAESVAIQAATERLGRTRIFE